MIGVDDGITRSLFADDGEGCFPCFGGEDGTVDFVGVLVGLLAFGGELTMLDPVVGLGDVGDGGGDGAGNLIVTVVYDGFMGEVKAAGTGEVLGAGEVDVDVEVRGAILVGFLADAEVDGGVFINQVVFQPLFRGRAMRKGEKELDTLETESVLTRLTRHGWYTPLHFNVTATVGTVGTPSVYIKGRDYPVPRKHVPPRDHQPRSRAPNHST